MTGMQASLPPLIVRLSILNPVINFSIHLMTSEMKCPIAYLCLVHFHFHRLPLKCQCNTCTDTISRRYDPLHIVMQPSWSIDLDLTCSSPPHGPSEPSLARASPSHGPSLHCLDLSFTHPPVSSQASSRSSPSVTWLHVMSHIQWSSFISHSPVD